MPWVQNARDAPKFSSQEKDERGQLLFEGNREATYRQRDESTGKMKQEQSGWSVVHMVEREKRK